jgi:hypothetical protein
MPAWRRHLDAPCIGQLRRKTMPTKFHEFGDRAPSVATLRKLLREDEKAGATLVVFERGEQFSSFEKVGKRWIHSGNGLLRAGYRLANELERVQ